MPRPPRTLLALIERPGHVCYRYRLEAFAPALAEAGWDLKALPLGRSSWPVLRELPQVAAADAVILQRRLLPWWRMRMLRAAAKRLIFDLDDAVFYRDFNAAKPYASWQRSLRFRAIVRAVDAVIVGNAFLQQQASRAGARPQPWLFPTCVATDLYWMARHERRPGSVQLAWIGSQETARALPAIQPMLTAAARRSPKLELKLICDHFPPLPGVPTRPCLWSQETEASALAEADIGISFMPDHPWSLGKCGLKVLQYLAAGLPVVANPIGIHKDLVRHGETGFLAATPEAWAEAVVRLATSPDLRRAIGRAGRQLVEQHYSVGRWSSHLAAVLDQIAEGQYVQPAEVPEEPSCYTAEPAETCATG